MGSEWKSAKKMKEDEKKADSASTGKQDICNEKGHANINDFIMKRTDYLPICIGTCNEMCENMEL